MKTIRLTVFFILMTSVVVMFTACGEEESSGGNEATFIPVISIDNVPDNSEVGSFALSGIVNPPNATKKTITWALDSFSSGTLPELDGNILTTTTTGWVQVRANIENGLGNGQDYSQLCFITIVSEFVPVTSITGIPSTAPIGSLLLSGSVEPYYATNTGIIWSLVSAGTTGASVSGNGQLTTTAAGTVTIKATIANGTANGTDYTQDFSIDISHVPVTSITGVPVNGTVGNLSLGSVTVNPGNASYKTIVWSIVSAGATGATVSGSTLTTTAGGNVTIKATITNGTAPGTNYTQDFSITMVKPVTNITGIPDSVTQRIGKLTLSPTVVPSDATNKTIVWSITSWGTTGASLSGSVLTTATPGTVTVRATITNGKGIGTDYTQDFSIAVHFPIIWSTITSTFGTSDINAVTFGTDRFVAVGTGGKIAYANAGTSHLFEAAMNLLNSGNTTLVGVTRGGSSNYFVAACGADSAAYSTANGAYNWSLVSIPYFEQKMHTLCIAANSNYIVAGGLAGYMAYSTSGGTTWTNIPSGDSGTTFNFSTNVTAVNYLNGRFIAGTANGTMAYSTSGSFGWTAITTPFPSGYRINGFAYGNNVYVAVANLGKIAYSGNGTNWTMAETSTFGDSDIMDVCFSSGVSGGLFVAVGNNGKMAYSSDGINWVAIPSGTSNTSTATFGSSTINGIAYGNNAFIAVGASGKMARATITTY